MAASVNGNPKAAKKATEDTAKNSLMSKEELKAAFLSLPKASQENVMRRMNRVIKIKGIPPPKLKQPNARELEQTSISTPSEQDKPKIKYLNEYHKANSQAAMKYIAESKKHPFSLEDALKQQERNSKDKSPDTNKKT